MLRTLDTKPAKFATIKQNLLKRTFDNRSDDPEEYEDISPESDEGQTMKADNQRRRKIKRRKMIRKRRLQRSAILDN